MSKVFECQTQNSEYAAFLNAKAKSDPHNLMVSGGGEIIRDGDGGYPTPCWKGVRTTQVLFVAAVDAMRMANSLNKTALPKPARHGTRLVTFPV